MISNMFPLPLSHLSPSLSLSSPPLLLLSPLPLSLSFPPPILSPPPLPSPLSLSYDLLLDEDPDDFVSVDIPEDVSASDVAVLPPSDSEIRLYVTCSAQLCTCIYILLLCTCTCTLYMYILMQYVCTCMHVCIHVHVCVYQLVGRVCCNGSRRLRG